MKSRLNVFFAILARKCTKTAFKNSVSAVSRTSTSL